MTVISAPVPMTPDTPLLEPSFAVLIAAVEKAADLTGQTRRHWVCSVRQIAKWLDRPPEEIPARWNAIRMSVRQLHHARVGVTAKTFANHKSNVRAALRWFGNEHGVPQMGARLTPEWVRFRDGLERPIRDRLYNFVRYCSARGIDPSSIDDTIFQDYWTYRTEFTGMAVGNATRRPMVRAWNTCVAARKGSSLQPLTVPPIKVAMPPWEEFPENLRRDIESFLAGLAKSRRSANGKRVHPCSPTTIANRRDELVAFIRMAVRLGFPLKSLTSFTALLNPDVVEKVLDAYWQKNGKEPKTYTIDLGWKLLRMARETCCLDHAALNRLDEISATLEQHRHEGMTSEKPTVNSTGTGGRRVGRSGFASECAYAGGTLG